MSGTFREVGCAKGLRNGIDSFCWWNFKTRIISVGEGGPGGAVKRAVLKAELQTEQLSGEEKSKGTRGMMTGLCFT